MRWPPKNRTIRHSWRFKAATGTGVKRNETCSLNEVMRFPPDILADLPGLFELGTQCSG